MDAPTQALHRTGSTSFEDDDLPEPIAGLRHSVNPPPPLNPLRLGRLALIIAIVVVAGLLVGFLPRLKSRAAVRAESRELSVPTVTVVTPSPAKAPPALALSGEIKPLIDASIYARANGYVRRWLVDLGAH